MAHVVTTERAAGTAYTVRWRDGTKFRQRSFLATKGMTRRDHDKVAVAAATFALDIGRDLDSGAPTAPRARAGKTVAEVAAASLAASEARLKPRTFLSYQQGYSRYVLPAFGHKRIAAVTSEHVEAWVAALQKDGSPLPQSGTSTWD